ncbi:MAG: hypothetical protein HW419_2109 [Deltaproteobacteria bacterium]|nr:hypothetical protein [Deltaproteobacteria bacterium]
MFKTIRQQEAVGCDTQSSVMMKSTPAPSLVVAQAELLLELLIVPLNAPAHLGGPDQIHKRGVSGQRRQPILGRFCLIYRPFDQQPLFGTRSAKPLVVTMRRPHSHSGEARRQWLVGSLAPAHRAPSLGWQRFGQLLHTERCTAWHTPPPCGRTSNSISSRASRHAVSLP